MKKVLLLLLAFAMMFGFLDTRQIWASDGSTLDQSYEVMTMMGYGKVGVSGMGQTFRPSLNRISSIEVYLTNRTSDAITMTIQNPATKQIVGTETHSLTFAGDAAWEAFGFTPNLIVQPDTEYVMYLSSNVDNATRWMMSGDAPQYTRGFAVIVDHAQESYDMLFREYGKTVTDPVVPPTSTPTVESQTKVITPTTTTVLNLAEPVLTYIMNGEKRTDAPLTEDIVVVKGTKIVLFGTAFKGAKVTVSVGGVGKLAVIDADGNWNYTIDDSLLVEKLTVVSAQAQDEKDNKSDEIQIAKLKKPTTTAIVSAAVATTPWYSNPTIQAGLLALGLLVIAALLATLYFLVKRRKDKTAQPDKTLKE